MTEDAKPTEAVAPPTSTGEPLQSQQVGYTTYETR